MTIEQSNVHFQESITHSQLRKWNKRKTKQE
jgi:hypothetical protein